jgi:hypothetical protein
LENQKFTRVKVNGKIYNFKDFLAKGTAWKHIASEYWQKRKRN